MSRERDTARNLFKDARLLVLSQCSFNEFFSGRRAVEPRLSRDPRSFTGENDFIGLPLKREAGLSYTRTRAYTGVYTGLDRKSIVAQIALA